VALSLGLASFSLAGLYCNHADLSPRYSSILLGLTNTTGALPGIVGVAITGAWAGVWLAGWVGGWHGGCQVSWGRACQARSHRPGTRRALWSRLPRALHGLRLMLSPAPNTLPTRPLMCRLPV
jgi:hypothetical protein